VSPIAKESHIETERVVRGVGVGGVLLTI